MLNHNLEQLFHELRLVSDKAGEFANKVVVIPTTQAMTLIDKFCAPMPEDSEIERVAFALHAEDFKAKLASEHMTAHYEILAKAAIAAMRHQKPVSLEAENKRLREALEAIAAECKNEWWKHSKEGWDCDTPGVVVYAYNKAQSAIKQESSE